MKKNLFIFIFLFILNESKSQNAFGLTFGYGKINTPQWNDLLDKYNSSDTVLSKHPNFKNYPLASFFYERKIAEFFYVQGLASCAYTKSVSNQNGQLIWKLITPSLGINLNWYPFKMIKGMSKTPANPILLQFGGASNYIIQTLKLNGKDAISDFNADFKSSKFAFFFSAGIGYDLHFGKRIVVQTVFNANLCPGISNPDLLYFIPKPDKLGLTTLSSATVLSAKVSFLFLFKRLRGKKNNVNSKRSMFS